MHAVCEGFDDFFSRWYPDIRRLCFAMSENDKDARNLAFKTFLRLGAAKRRKIPAFFKRLHALRRLLRPEDAPPSRQKGARGHVPPVSHHGQFMCVPEAAARPARSVLPCSRRVFGSGNRENRRKIRRAFCLFFHTESRFGAGSRFFHSIRRKRRRCHERRNLCALCRAQRRRGKQDSRFPHRL